MKRLFETIKVNDGELFNIEWHNQRVNRSRFELFQTNRKINLEEVINDPPKEGLYRCRVVYDKEIDSVNYYPYQAKSFKSFKVVDSSLEYGYKFDDRSEINQLLLDNYDEIIIEKDGLLTDTSIANIAFYDGRSWVTPKKPLLEGTTRARLLEENFLQLKDIRKEQIKNYSHFALMNAMIGFQLEKIVNIRT